MSSRAMTSFNGRPSAAAWWLFGTRTAAVTATVLVGRLLAEWAMQLLVRRSASLDLPGELAAAIASGVALTWVAGRLAGSRTVRLAATTLVAFVSVAAVMIEGSAFAPALSPIDQLRVGLVLQLGVCLAAAAVATAGTPAVKTAPASAHRAGLRLVVGVVAATVTYVVAYLVTGAVTYLLVTGPYYESHAGGLTTPAPPVVLAVAVVEGAMLTLATVPMARLLPGPRASRALACGLVLWLLGGLVPLLQAAALPDVLRVASAVEILFQKVPLGMAVVWFCSAAAATRPKGER